MHVFINVKSSNNINKWQVGFNSAFKRLILGRKQSSGGKCCLHSQEEDEYRILVNGAY
jgi:hypothetical protein